METTTGREQRVTELKLKLDDVRRRIRRVMANTRYVYRVVLGGSANGTYKVLSDGVERASYTASNSTVRTIRDALNAALLLSQGEVWSVEKGTADTLLIESWKRGSILDVAATTTGSPLTVTEQVVYSKAESSDPATELAHLRAAETDLVTRLASPESI